MVFGIIPECRSASLRNKRSASPESPARIDERIAELRALRNIHTEEHLKRGAGRTAIAEAQRKRWAEATTEAPTAKRAKKKRVLSAAGKAAIVAALKKRWAAKKAEAKKTAISQFHAYNFQLFFGGRLTVFPRFRARKLPPRP